MAVKITGLTRGIRRAAALAWLVLALAAFPAGASAAGTEETYKGLKIFSDIIEEVEKNYVDPVDSKDLIEKAIQGMVHSLDPHSVFLSPEDYEELQEGTRKGFGGIGIKVSTKDGVLTVISPIEGTPAHRAGILAGDVIIKVDGKSTREMKPYDAIKMMRGRKGEPVVITIARRGEQEPIDFELVRAEIPIESVKYITLQRGFGYLRVFNFRENTTEEVEKALEGLEPEGTPLRGLVLDLRNNPGGLLNQAIGISDLFIDKGVIVSIRGREETETNVFKAHDEGKERDYPIVLLINGGSASASEIVAGALQDHGRALLLGTTTFGKASVQTVKSLKDGYGIKYTIARYYTPNGRSIQAQGIEPDIRMKHRMVDEAVEEGEEYILKEKDLTNHIEAKGINGEKEEEPKKGEPAEADDDASGGMGGLRPATLLKDNQIKRALDILIGHAMFGKLND